MLNNGCLLKRLLHIGMKRSQARSRDLGRAVAPVDTMYQDLLAPADRLEVALGNASGARPR